MLTAALIAVSVLLVGMTLACLCLVVCCVYLNRVCDEVTARADASDAKVVYLLGICTVRGHIIRLYRERVEREAGLAVRVVARSFGHRN